MEFIKLIDKAIMTIDMEIKKNKCYFERYQKMRKYLESLKKAYELEVINRKDIYLSIVRMLENGDSEQLQDAITAVNHFYQDNIYRQ